MWAGDQKHIILLEWPYVGPSGKLIPLIHLVR